MLQKFLSGEIAVATENGRQTAAMFMRASAKYPDMVFMHIYGPRLSAGIEDYQAGKTNLSAYPGGVCLDLSNSPGVFDILPNPLKGRVSFAEVFPSASTAFFVDPCPDPRPDPHPLDIDCTQAIRDMVFADNVNGSVVKRFLRGDISVRTFSSAETKRLVDLAQVVYRDLKWHNYKGEVSNLLLDKDKSFGTYPKDGFWIDVTRKSIGVNRDEDGCIAVVNYTELFPVAPTAETPAPPATDEVNRPAHYTSGRIEVIDFIEDQKLGYHLGNVVKYVARAGKKDPSKRKQDLEKAAWYLNREIQNIK